VTATVKAWSFSAWDLHHQCPLRFKLLKLDKLKEEAGPALLRGRKVHTAMKDYLAAPYEPGTPPGAAPPEAGKAAELAEQVRQFDNRVVEQQWGYTATWKPTAWFGNTTWFRCILDVGIIYDDNTAEVVDWKTGKPRGTYKEEMELFAMALMLRAPHVTHVSTRLAFTDVKHEVFDEFPAAALEPLINTWNRRVAPMFTDTSYLPRPNEGCKWCDFSRSKGGQCRYG
jgi:hypothetical protein